MSTYFERGQRFLSRPLRRSLMLRRGRRFGRHVKFVEAPSDAGRVRSPLEEYFDAHTAGRGIWKWRHYFEAYDRHFSRFVGKEVCVLEIGVYSGGSLEMWRRYFGPDSRVHGVDIEPGCKAYEDEGIEVTIGDQGDPAFWSTVLERIPQIDIVIDDGGHLPQQQIVTLEALLPHISPGGVYVCEDIFGSTNEVHAYVHGLARNLHTWDIPDYSVARTVPSELQKMVASIHLYPFMVVIERASAPRSELSAPRRGTEWEPFVDSEPGQYV